MSVCESDYSSDDDVFDRCYFDPVDCPGCKCYSCLIRHTYEHEHEWPYAKKHRQSLRQQRDEAQRRWVHDKENRRRRVAGLPSLEEEQAQRAADKAKIAELEAAMRERMQMSGSSSSSSESGESLSPVVKKRKRDQQRDSLVTICKPKDRTRRQREGDAFRRAKKHPNARFLWLIKAAIAAKQPVSIVYAGGSNPCAPRQVRFTGVDLDRRVRDPEAGLNFLAENEKGEQRTFSLNKIHGVSIMVSQN